MRTLRRCASFCFIQFVLLVATIGCAGSGSDLAFFQNKTVTIIVPFGTGGGIDAYARAISPYIQKYLPGSKVVVQNIPDASSLTGRNKVFTAQPDGLTLGFAPISGVLLAEWEGLSGIKYKTAEFSLIGRIMAEAHVMVVSPKTGYTSLKDIVQAKKISMGTTGISSDDHFVGLMTAHILGYQVDTRATYLSAGEANLSCVKGEVDAVLFNFSTVQPLIAAKTLVPVVSFSNSRLLALPDTPTIFEMIPADQQELMQAIVQIYALDRVLFAPPNMSASRLQVLRQALDQAIADPELKQTMNTLKRPVDYLTGSEVGNLLQGILASENTIKPLVQMIAQRSK